MELFIDPLQCTPAAAQPFEVVERKGIGHPDTICDALAEEFSNRLSRFYLDRFGHIAHHNVDKALLWGGVARPVFGGGEVEAPMEIFLSGRVTDAYRGVAVPVEEIAVDGCREWFRTHLHAVDPERHVRVHCLTRPGSAELVELFARQVESGVRLANDTSCGVGFAPPSRLETMVREVERGLNADAVKRDHPEIGEDIKIMGARRGGHVELTLACAFVAAHVADMDDYLAKKRRLASHAKAIAREATGLEPVVAVNTADDADAGNVYLTVTGTSAEAGDDGQVGRGNRANGLITPFRPMTMEAVAGKNPMTHVGKLYNLAAGRIAADLVREIAPATDACCCLVSRIGGPIDDPAVASLGVRIEDGRPVDDIRPEAAEIVRGNLSRLGRLYEETVHGEARVY